MADRPLTPKQQRFVEEYLVDLCAKSAATRAGYSVKSAECLGYQLLQNPRVAAAVSAGREAQSKRTGITADVILGELLRIGRADLGQAFDEDGNLLPIKQIPEDVRRAMSGIDVEERRGDMQIDAETGDMRHIPMRVHKVRFWDKKGALELLGKHLNLFVDRTELTGPGGAPITVIIDTGIPPTPAKPA